jgi:DNA-binding NtrC family response regulator
LGKLPADVDSRRSQTIDEPRRARPPREDDELLALVVVHAAEPGLVGTVALVRDPVSILGRGDATPEDGAPRLVPIRQRPGKNEDAGTFTSKFLSHVQLRIERRPAALVVENVGRCALRTSRGDDVDRLEIEPGGVFSLGEQLLFLVTRRPERLASLRTLRREAVPSFGAVDTMGIVGESRAAWELRDVIAFLGLRTAHVLVLGPSGSGKEVAAQAIHQSSIRAPKRIVTRNAATIPPALADAELFGNAPSYPNAGMPERPGLIGEADGSTLFLDEIGELPEDVQTKLLRILDGPGDYQRLGDARRRTSSFRLIGATNRPLDALRHDVAARFKLRVSLPGLTERREDVPLLARHLLATIAAAEPDIGAQFFHGWDGKDGTPRMTLAFARALVLQEYQTHVRELENLLWASIGSSRGDELDVTADVEQLLTSTVARTAPRELTVEEVKAALERAGGSREKAWRELGLASRHVLKRLMKKYGLDQDDQGA